MMRCFLAQYSQSSKVKSFGRYARSHTSMSFSFLKSFFSFFAIFFIFSFI